MKKRIYYILYPIISIINIIILMFGAEKIATTQMETLGKLTPELNKILSVSSFANSIRLCCVISIICMVIFLITAIRKKIPSNKGLAMSLAVVPIFILSDIVSTILGIITLIVLSKEKTKHKEKKKIEKLDKINVTTNNIIMSVILIIVYIGSLFLAGFFADKSYGIYIDILSKLAVLGLAIYTFKDRYKRDIKEFKKNFGGYITIVFKWWGIMLLLSFVASIVKVILRVELVPGNQQQLNEMNLFYLFPIAVIWAPIVEEAIYRGCLKRFISNDKIFVIVSTVIFGLIHTIFAESGIFTILVQSLQYMAMGFALSYSYSKTNNICVDTSIHFIQNFLAIIISSIMF